jgi:hypothetical protein
MSRLSSPVGSCAAGTASAQVRRGASPPVSSNERSTCSVERVSLRSCDHFAPRVRSELSRGELGEELVRLGVGERPELELDHAVGMVQAGTLSEPAIVRVRLEPAGRGDDERKVVEEVQQALHQLESAAVRPVEIVDRKDDRSLLAKPA